MIGKNFRAFSSDWKSFYRNEDSFKGSVPLIILWQLVAGGNLRRLVATRIHVLQSLLYKRRKRPSQPRACKLRKQRFPYLTAPRGEYIEIPHIKKYRKGA